MADPQTQSPLIGFPDSKFSNQMLIVDGVNRGMELTQKLRKPSTNIVQRASTGPTVSDIKLKHDSKVTVIEVNEPANLQRRRSSSAEATTLVSAMAEAAKLDRLPPIQEGAEAVFGNINSEKETLRHISLPDKAVSQIDFIQEQSMKVIATPAPSIKLSKRQAKPRNNSRATELINLKKRTDDDSSINESSTKGSNTNTATKANGYSPKGRQIIKSSLSSPFLTRSNRQLLTGCRLVNTGVSLASKALFTVVALRPPLKSEWTSRFVLFGGSDSNCGSNRTGSTYFECEYSDDQLLGNAPLNWKEETLNPEVDALTGHTAVGLEGIDADKFVVIGGGSRGTLFSSVYVVDAGTKKSYTATTTGKQPAARSEHSCCLINSVIYIFGGRIPKSIERVKSSLNTKKNLERLGSPRVILKETNSPISNISESSETIPKHFGGDSMPFNWLTPCKVFSDLWKIDLKDFEWHAVPLQPDLPELKKDEKSTITYEFSKVDDLVSSAVPSGRFGHVHGVWNKACYIMGGFDGESVNDEIWRLSSSDKWKQMMPRGGVIGKRSNAASTVYQDFWYIHGGINEKGSILNDFLIIDFVTWSLERVCVDVAINPSRVLPSLAYHCAVAVPLQMASSNHLGAILLFGGVSKLQLISNAAYCVIPSCQIVQSILSNPENSEKFAKFPIRNNQNLIQKKFDVSRTFFRFPFAPLDAAGMKGQLLDVPLGSVQSDYRQKNSANQPGESLILGGSLDSMESTVDLRRGLSNVKNSNVCGDCESYKTTIQRLQMRCCYLAKRLMEYRSDNLTLKENMRTVSKMKHRLESTETEIEKYRSLRRHPMLGKIIRSCFDALEDSFLPEETADRRTVRGRPRAASDFASGSLPVESSVDSLDDIIMLDVDQTTWSNNSYYDDALRLCRRRKKSNLKCLSTRQI